MAKVALAQFRAATDKQRNLKRIIGYIEEAANAGAGLIAFPEFMMFYTPSAQTPRQLHQMAEELDGGFVQEISDAASRHSIQVVGTTYEKSKKDKVYDTAFFLDHRGKMISYYRKIHLYDALGFRESDKIMPGVNMPVPVKSKIGKIGMMICYDLRFPEMPRSLAVAGSQVLVAPSAWVAGESKEEHWIAINKTRAIENGCYVIAPDQVGNIYCGRSLVVDPFGKMLVDMKKRQGIALAEISSERIKKVRKALPLLKNRRPEIY